MKERTMKTTFYKTALAGGFALSLATASTALLAQGMPQSGPHAGQMQEHMHGGAGMDKRMSPNAERFLRLYDLNGDGKVTVDEINADQARMFGALDINSDKALSVSEMQRRGRSLQLWRTVTMFDLLDLNSDGKISVEELQGPTKRWFARHDLNKNGILEPEELPAPRWGRGRGRR